MATTPDLVAPRPPYVRRERSRLEQILIVSLIAHALLIGVIIEARYLTGHHAPQAQDPGFEMVFGNATQTAQATTQADATPPPPAPEVSLSPQEFVPPPLAPSPDVVPVPRPRPPPKRRAVANNPFANMPLYGFGPTPSTRRVPQQTRGLNLAMDSTAQGGVTEEINPDISAPGAEGWFLRALSQYVESHKYYPDLAVRNGESGVAVIKGVFARDGTVISVQLLQSSGSRTLDVAWMDLFKHKRVPLPMNMTNPTQEVVMSMDFELVQQ
jgi:TonB family protein